MKILHICLACFYPDNFSYQENMLPKFHKEQGHEVEVIASLFTFDQNGKGSEYPEAKRYLNEYNIPVTRLDYRFPKKFNRIYKRFVGLKGALEKFSPEIIFIHGCQFADVDIVADYAKMHEVIIYVDNHADFSNSAKNILSRKVLHGMLWRKCAHIIEPYTKKFYGVMPARVDYLKNVYKLPAEKCKLLVMGADDELVNAASIPSVRKEVREKYNITDKDFLIISGGKIDNFKKQTLLLMDAVNAFDDPRVKLIIFGSVIPELKTEVEKRCSDRVHYIGWIKASDSYRYFASCNLACFPGRHSVFWEQVVGQGIPMLVKKWDGTTHIDMGGNVRFLMDDTCEEIKASIQKILSGENYEKMLLNAKRVSHAFLYSDIARRSIEN